MKSKHYHRALEGWKNSLPDATPEVWHQKAKQTERHYLKHHAKHHTKTWLPWLLLILALLLLASKAHAQGSSIYTIKFQDSVGTTLKTYASPFTIKCGANVTCTAGAGGILTITASVTGGGGGSVTSFTSGNLAPLFTTSVATSTTTPVQSFALSNAAAHTFFGNNTGSAAAPSYFVPVAADLPNLPESQITSLVTDLAGKASSTASTTVNGVTCTLGSTCTVADSTKVPTTTTVNGHALSSNVSVTATDVGLGSVTNDAQTKAAIVPNTLPSTGQTLIGNAGGTAYAPQAFSGDCTLASTGAITCTKTNSVAFGTLATSSATLPANTAATTSNFLTGYNSTTGAFIKAQPAYSDISGTPTLPATKALSTGFCLDSYSATTGLFTTEACGGAGGGMTNPMTTLGDLIYEDATPTPTRLAGNTTTTKKYLSQTGTGTESAVPAWAQPAASEISGLAASATTDTTNAANITSGTLPAGRLPAMTGDATSTAGSNSSTVVAVNGTTVPTNAAADQTLVTTASAVGAWKSIGSCSGTSNALTYNTTTHAWGCNTITGSGSTPTGTGFVHITAGVQDGASAAVNLGTADTAGSITAAKAVDPATYMDISDEFISGTVTSGAIGQLGWTIASGTATNLTGAAANHPGVLQRATGTTSSTITYMETLNAVATMPLNTISNVAWKVTWIAGQDSTSTNPSTQITIRLGLICNGAASSAPSQGIYFENVTTTTAANWSGVVKGASTSTSGGTTALNTSYHRFEITNDGSNNIQFFLDGTQYGSTVTTNIPTTSCMPFTQIINTEATNKVLNVDYFRMWMALTR